MRIMVLYFLMFQLQLGRTGVCNFGRRSFQYLAAGFSCSMVGMVCATRPAQFSIPCFSVSVAAWPEWCVQPPVEIFTLTGGCLVDEDGFFRKPGHCPENGVFCEKCRAGVDVIVTVRLPDLPPERFAGQTGRVTPVCLRQARLTPLAWLYGAKVWYPPSQYSSASSFPPA